jgi:hypothetical protein
MLGFEKIVDTMKLWECLTEYLDWLIHANMYSQKALQLMLELIKALHVRKLMRALTKLLHNVNTKYTTIPAG